MEVLFTERAHLMCPAMCFGIVFSVKAAFDETHIRDTVAVLSNAHPFLKALLGYEPEKNTYFYAVTERSPVEIRLKEEEISSADDDAVLQEYRHLTGYDWELFKEGMLKLTAWKMPEGMCFLLTFHHLLTDGRGALGLAQELADYYVSDIVPKYAAETLIASVGDFPEKSALPFISRMLIHKANRDWRKEAHAPLTYQTYHEYADRFVELNTLQYHLHRVEKHKMSKLSAQCHEVGVTVNDWLMAQMLVEENTNKLIIARDLRNQLACYTSGALGNYSTAFSVVIRKKSRNILTIARRIHQSVQKTLHTPSALYLVLQCYAHLEPALVDAAFMASKGAFESKAADFIGTRFFGLACAQGYSITNLGKIESDSIDTAYFIPPASPAMKKTQGVLTVNGEMTICTAIREAEISRPWLLKSITEADMHCIRFLSFSYTVNMARYGDVYYDLKRENEQYTVQICPNGVPSEKTFRCQVDEQFAEEIAAWLRQYKVSQWNGFHKVDKRILDGRSFTLVVHFENGKKIHAHGYMRYPKNYRAFRDAMDACFMRLYAPQE